MHSFLYSTETIREIEHHAHDQQLMKCAAKAVFDFFMQQKAWRDHPVCIFAGSGNNGGDALELALLMHQQNINVHVITVGARDQQSTLMRAAEQECQRQGVRGVSLDKKYLSDKAIIIDGLLGIGFHGELTGEYAEAARMINQSGCPVLAIDIPTGLHADSGLAARDAVRATHTVTFIALKIGLFMNEGPFLSGKISLRTLDVDLKNINIKPCARLLSVGELNSFLKPRSSSWHKGNSGRVWIVGGDTGFAGAPILAAQAALHAGAGLVTVATHAAHTSLVIAQQAELMSFIIDDAVKLKMHLEKLDKVNAMVLGSGLGLNTWSELIWKELISVNFPLILDGDGLNWLSRNGYKKNQWILTPHAMEAARLLNCDVADVNANRLRVAIELQQRYGGVLVLKGAGTLIVGEQELPVLVHRGNSGMATAGMGDVLSGVIAAYVAEGLTLFSAACAATSIHAAAGDLSAEEDGARGMVASDLFRFIRRLSNGFSYDEQLKYDV